MLVGAALLFSTGGMAIKATSLNGWQIAGLRSIVAAITLALLIPEARRAWNWRVLVAGLAYASVLISFVLATKLTTSASAIFLQSTAPAYLLLIGPLLLKEPLSRADGWFSLALAIGAGLLFMGTEGPQPTAPDPVRGNLLGAFSGMAYAFTLAALRWQARRDASGGGALATVTAGNLLAFLLCMPMALPLPPIGGKDAGVILYLGVIQIGLAYWLLTRGMRRVPAFESSALLLVEPVCNPVWVWFVQREQPGPGVLAGGAIILVSTLARIWSSRK
jgi:drug/metabolite transporter, DME family